MLQLRCSGTPYEVGQQHGQGASNLIAGTIAFYESLFIENSGLDWQGVTRVASEFEPVIRRKWPAYYEEMRGVAEGSGKTVLDIIAINVRTEINFGLATDGCTAMSWHTPNGESWLAQNWDWKTAQKVNIILLHIIQPGKPEIKMVTEAGLIGKIGLNSAGVGVCLNAIFAKGMDPTRIPCHLGLRLALECQSFSEAVAKLEKYGVASACHYLLADGDNGGLGIEWSSLDSRHVQQDDQGRVFHSNHYLAFGDKMRETPWKDSFARVDRIRHLANGLDREHLGHESIFSIFKDEDGLPGAICRKQAAPKSTSATLFNIIMELKERRAWVALGKPTAPEERIEMSFKC